MDTELVSTNVQCEHCNVENDQGLFLVAEAQLCLCAGCLMGYCASSNDETISISGVLIVKFEGEFGYQNDLS